MSTARARRRSSSRATFQRSSSAACAARKPELLDAERQALRDAQQSAQQTERALRDQLAAQGIALAQAQSQGSALQQRLDDLQGQFDEERRSHDGTRALLAGALAAVRKPRGVRKPSPGAGEALLAAPTQRIDARKPPGLAPRE
ncbi:hypothetical protein [Variovorax sp. CF079]|uniref:hypothetical protein n=1 Tax=Variovorax sp. CF079 TaxID=1882774 RepID=UPI000B8725AD|nr:hypothetical protein [Variovorax sp. CF079]